MIEGIEQKLPSKRRSRMISRLIRGLLRNRDNPLTSTTDPAPTAVNLPRIEGKLEIVRDRNGVPHIYADVERDLYAALGFLQAADRFTFIDIIRHLGSGRLTELVGDYAAPKSADLIGGKRISDIDAFLRPLAFEEESQKDYLALADRERAAVDAYAEGVNAALRAMKGCYPVEYIFLSKPRLWRPEDCLLAARASAFTVTLTCIENELTFDAVRGAVGDDVARELYPGCPLGQRPDVVLTATWLRFPRPDGGRWDGE